MSAKLRLASLAFVLPLLSIRTLAQVTELVSVGASGAPANSWCYQPSVSDDGRYVVYYTSASNLVPGDTTLTLDVIVRDRWTRTNELVSVSTAGTGGNQESGVWFHPMSPDGRFIAFDSNASDLISGDTNGFSDVFLRDRQSGTTERVSVSSAEVQGNGDSYLGTPSADGRYVVFSSSASNLVPGDTNGKMDIFVRDRLSGTTERVSTSSLGTEGDGDSQTADISLDGRYVAFYSFASNLVAGDSNGTADIFVKDRQTGLTQLVSLYEVGGQLTNVGPWFDLSADGRSVAFSDQTMGGVYLMTPPATHSELLVPNYSGYYPQLDASGTYVAYASQDLAYPPDGNGNQPDVFVLNRVTGAGERASVSSSGLPGNNESAIYGMGMSSDGRFVTFDSLATNLVSGPSSPVIQIYIRDREATGFTSLCHPGVDGIRTCPCGNPPSAVGRGCNNSASTGGAMLAASGAAYLSTDNLVFMTSGEKPTATSTLWQGPGISSTGVVFGQAVRCANGTLRRLFNKSAVGGSITAPNFGAGDPTISARSAAKGDVISAGQSRYYFVSYRDPVVLGGCPALSTFNATQTGRVVWSP